MRADFDVSPRFHGRSNVLWAAKLTHSSTAIDNPPQDCVVFDVSAGGVKLSFRDGLETGEWVSLTLRFGTFRARVAWKNETWVGLTFEHEPADVVVRIPAIAGYGSPPLERIECLSGHMN